LDEQPGAFVERDAASQGTIDHIRSIVEELPYVLLNAQKRIYLFDEAHRMSVAAQDVLLKPLEEKKMVGMFCTTEAEKIRGAIRSRCEEYTIRKIMREDILKRMQMILTTEAVSFEEEAVLIVIDHSGGHVRDVINKLEMISQLGPVTKEAVREYLHLSVVTNYYNILLNLDDPKKAIELMDAACDQVSPEDVSAGIAEAAMNTFRIANGLVADFTYVDKELASKVYAKYQNHVIRFAYWFLGSRFTTQLSLARDLAVFAQTPGNLPLDGPTPPVVFAGSMPQLNPVQAQPAQPAPSTVSRVAPTQSKQSGLKSYADPTIPTPTEALVVNMAMPRTRKQEVVIPKSENTAKSLTPAEWSSRWASGWEQIRKNRS
jgi:DNA polymerase III gamma/tau subunit